MTPTTKMKHGNEVDSAKSLVPDIIELRDEALKQGDFKYAVILSHVIANLNDPVREAAPELLEALKRLLEVAENGEGMDKYAQEAARTAIKKASL